jgi:hypothetical protein
MIDAFARKQKERMVKQKNAKCKARNYRGTRRTQVRRSEESDCSNAAVGEFLRRHHD